MQSKDAELVPEILATTIHGVLLLPLKEIPAAGGPVLHMVNANSPLFSGFGEVYGSFVEPYAVKAWKKHSRQTQLFSVPIGNIEVVLYDARERSSSFGSLLRVLLGRPDDYQLLRIPHGVWYGFRALLGESALVVNCVDLPHDPNESERLPKDTPLLPSVWD